jgi:hypothetical protein
MTAPKKPSASEAWEAIDEAAFKAEVDRVVAMSDEDVEGELVKEGFDPAKVGSGKGAGKGPVAPVPVTEARVAPVKRLPLHMRNATWLAAAGFLLVLGTVAVMNRDPNVTRSPAQHAAELRNDAKEECAKARWRACLDRLGEADGLDPEGAADTKVKALRKEAEQGVGGH